MKWKTVAKALLFPPLAVVLILLPVATVWLIYAMVFQGETSLAACVSYGFAAYTLTVWCVRIPQWIRTVRRFKDENRLARRWQDDVRLRVTVSLYGSLLWNTAYAVFQMGLGFYHGSFWFFAMAGYYMSLAVMRFFLLRHTRRHVSGEKTRTEYRQYRVCGIVFLVMNLAVSLMIFFMVYWNRTFYHHEITTIALAAYTFTSFATAIVNVVKYRRFNSPVFSASKAISFAAACVSMLTLESTMLTTFDDGSLGMFGRQLLLALSGAAVSIVIIAMAVYMIVHSSKQLKRR